MNTVRLDCILGNRDWACIGYSLIYSSLKARMIEVVFCIDASFWHPLTITISSLLLNNPGSEFRLFVVGTPDVFAGDQASLRKLIADAGNATLELVPFDNTVAYGHLPVHGHISLATYLRLFLTACLPATVDKVIYLDSDVLVLTHSFGELWKIDLGNRYVGAAREPFDSKQRLPLGFGPEDFYFNAGVMVVNLKKWRDEDVVPRFLQFAESNQAILFSPDQDILNSVFRGEVIDIGVGWNWQALFPRLTPKQLHVSREQYATWKHTPEIVHFTSRYKPWFWKWAPHYQAIYLRVSGRIPSDVPRPKPELRHVPTRLAKISQRFLEWHLPSLARALRRVRGPRRRVS